MTGRVQRFQRFFVVRPGWWFVSLVFIGCSITALVAGVLLLVTDPSPSPSTTVKGTAPSIAPVTESSRTVAGDVVVGFTDGRTLAGSDALVAGRLTPKAATQLDAERADPVNQRLLASLGGRTLIDAGLAVSITRPLAVTCTDPCLIVQVWAVTIVASPWPGAPSATAWRTFTVGLVTVAGRYLLDTLSAVSGPVPGPTTSGPAAPADAIVAAIGGVR